MNSKIRKLVSAITVGCLLLLGGTALASGAETPPYPQGPPDINQQLNHSLNALIADGTINNQQADKLRQFFKNPPNLIRDLVEYVGLSADQAKAVADAMRPPGPPPGSEQQLNHSLDKLVGNNTLSKQQADKVRNFLMEKGKEHQADANNMSSCDFFPKPPPDIIGDLIKYAGLSEHQAEAVADAIRPPGPPPGSEQQCPQNNP